MGYSVKLQKVERPASRSYYINLPIVLAETLDFNKGDVLEWSVKDHSTLLLRKIGSAGAKYLKKPKVRAKK